MLLCTVGEFYLSLLVKEFEFFLTLIGAPTKKMKYQ